MWSYSFKQTSPHLLSIYDNESFLQIEAISKTTVNDTLWECEACLLPGAQTLQRRKLDVES